MSTPEKNSKQIHFVELLRMINSSKLLFISIAAVCALSVAAFCGASFTKNAANVLTREFYTESNFSDLKIQCPLGFEESDTDVVKEDSDVKEAETGLWTHKYIDGGERKIIAEFFTKQENINKPNLMEGFLPEKEDECAIELEFSELLGLKVGDKIIILSDASPLVYTEFRITGIVTLPQVFLKNMPDIRGVSSIGTGEISTLILVDKTAFEEGTAPNVMYIVLDRSAPFFTDAYEQYVSSAKNRIAAKGANVVIERFADSRADYYSDLEEAEKEYEDGYSKYSSYLEEYDDLVERVEKLSSVSSTNSFSDKLESSRKQLDDAEYQLKKLTAIYLFCEKRSKRSSPETDGLFRTRFPMLRSLTITRPEKALIRSSLPCAACLSLSRSSSALLRSAV